MSASAPIHTGIAARTPAGLPSRLRQAVRLIGQTIAAGFCGVLLAVPLYAAEPEPASQRAAPGAGTTAPAPPPEPGTISASPAPAPAAAASGTRGIHPLDVRIFDWINRPYTAEHDVTVVGAPSDNAETIGRLREGVQAFVVGVVAGGNWLQLRMPDGTTTGYARAADFPAALGQAASPQTTAAQPPPPAPPAASPPAPAEAAGAPAAEDVITGHPTVIDTATLAIDGRLVSLDGVAGLDGQAAAELQSFIDASGNSVTCHPQGDDRHVCLLPNNTDVAMAALINGAALLGPDAPDSYLAERNDAVRNHRGMWGNCTLPAFAPPAGLPPELLQAYMARLAVNPLVEVEALGDGGWLIDGVPYALVDGAFRGIAFDAGLGGWGFRDRDGRWRGAPDRLRADLDRRHPRGEGLRREAGIRTERGERGGREGHEGREAGLHGEGHSGGHGFMQPHAANFGHRGGGGHMSGGRGGGGGGRRH